jgi:PTS system N-acetylglucosamine-specific IIC component
MSMRSAICLINVQVITGPEADTVADEIRTVIAQGGRDAVKPVATAAAANGAQGGPLDPDPLRWLAVFGGAGNVASLVIGDAAQRYAAQLATRLSSGAGAGAGAVPQRAQFH